MHSLSEQDSITPAVKRLNSLKMFRDVPILVSTEPLDVGGSCSLISWRNYHYRYWVKIAERARSQKFIHLFHEYTHVHQFESGKLRQEWQGDTFTGWIFEGEFFPTDFPYWNRPWEQEARMTSGAILRFWDKSDATLASVFKA